MSAGLPVVILQPYEGGLVRGERAADVVVPMPESGDETHVPFDATAYTSAVPGLYRYRQVTPTGTHTGLVGVVDAAAFADGRVRGHEQVLPERVDALVAHLAGQPVRVELVTTMHAAGPAFTAALVEEDDEPLVDVTTADDVRHTVHRIEADDALLAELDGVRHYVADGHHRVAASLRRWEETGRPDRFPVAVVSYAFDGLDLGAHPGADPADVPDLERIVALADAGETVPPKTTWFRPKPASGLFVRDYPSQVEV